jgi:hypothetical protein
MPTYIFECFEDEGGCGTQYEQRLSMSEIDSYKPKCPTCKKRKCVKRNLTEELSGVYFTNSQPQTLGALAEKNTSRLSNDERVFIKKQNTKYLDEPFQGSLPEGASLYPVDAQGRRLPSNEHKAVDPKKVVKPKRAPKKAKSK